MKFILARKESMTQIFTEDGRVFAGTILTASPTVVTQVKSPETDGYSAVQVGYGEQKPARINKAQVGHLKGKAYQVLREFRVENPSDFAEGAELTLASFVVGDDITVASAAKGRGFAGVVKRHGFHGGPRTHGQKHSEREPGSIGGGGRAGGRVAKGLRMGGRMGGNRVTVKNLRVLAVDAAAGQIIVSGAVPGSRGSLVEIISSSASAA